jgi:glycerol-3-phosphate dehydrogenase
MDDPTAKDRIIPVAGSHITYHSSIGSLKYGLCMPTSDGRILLILPWLNKIIAGTT